jgi:hypothetical protein
VRQDDDDDVIVVVVVGGGGDTVRTFKWSVNSIFTNASTPQPVGQLEGSARIHKKY